MLYEVITGRGGDVDGDRQRRGERAHVARGVGGGGRHVVAARRITSYNVCYTKLLR